MAVLLFAVYCFVSSFTAGFAVSFACQDIGHFRSFVNVSWLAIYTYFPQTLMGIHKMRIRHLDLVVRYTFCNDFEKVMI